MILQNRFYSDMMKAWKIIFVKILASLFVQFQMTAIDEKKVVNISSSILSRDWFPFSIFLPNII